MCGIVGIIGKKNSGNERALQLINHRGPDSQGTFSDRNVFFGHSRLSILDLSDNGSQPMYDDSGKYVIIFNGEIYNHLNVREKLIPKYEFKSNSDTETLLYGYIEFGEKVLNMLNGIFAFAIFNMETRQLFIARDQLGVKPLYYSIQNGRLIFGSEMKSFLAVDFDRELSVRGLLNYITFLWSPGETTPFQRVKKLLPGHYIRLSADNPLLLDIKKYYEIPFHGIYSKSSEQQIIDDLDEKLFNAVKRQLLSDVPVAFFLSGGLDSSAIVAMAKRIHPNQRLRCYTINASDGSDEGFSEDLIYARKVAEFLDLDLVEVDAKVDIITDFDKMVYHLDEPQADAAPLNVLNICIQAKKDGYKVLLGGTAGDDLFSGYRRHQALAYERYFTMIPRPLALIVNWSVSFLPFSKAKFRRIRKIAANLNNSKQDRIYSYFQWLPLKIGKNLFSEAAKPYLDKYDPKDYFFSLLKNIPEETSDLNKTLYWELRTFLVDHNLNYTDKLSMATGVEVRVPFLDLELVEFSTTIPLEMKMKGTVTKYILKKMMEKYLPLEVIYRSKAGFGAPVRNWVLNDLDEKISSYLSAEAINRRGIFNAQKISELISANKEGKIDASYSIWALLAIESWFRQFVDKEND
jgi:asparagine synthase (glutamine-hydrolysing)